MTYSLQAQADRDKLSQRITELEAQVAVLLERVRQLEAKPKRGRPRKNEVKAA